MRPGGEYAKGCCLIHAKGFKAVKNKSQECPSADCCCKSEACSNCCISCEVKYCNTVFRIKLWLLTTALLFDLLIFQAKATECAALGGRGPQQPPAAGRHCGGAAAKT